MKCKIFHEAIYNVEDEINDWLKTGDFEISHVKQSSTGDEYVLITIFYLTEKELRKKKLNNLNDHDTED